MALLVLAARESVLVATGIDEECEATWVGLPPTVEADTRITVRRHEVAPLTGEGTTARSSFQLPSRHKWPGTLGVAISSGADEEGFA